MRALRFVGRHWALWVTIAWASYSLVVGVESPRFWVIAAVGWCVCLSIQVEAGRLQDEIIRMLKEQLP